MFKQFRKAIYCLLICIYMGYGLCDAKKVAIFFEPLFPRFGATSNFHPQFIYQYLQRLGIASDLINADQLSDPKHFNPQRYAILIYPYGNTFPLEAVENIKHFHRSGGSIIAVSVPFCHPCKALGVRHWQYYLGDGDFAERTPQPFKGKYSLFVRKGSKVWTIIKSEYVDKKSEVCTLSAWVKVLSGNIGKDEEGDRLFLRFWGEEGKFLGQDGPSIPPQRGRWLFISKEIRIPPATHRVDVILALHQSTGEMLIDEVSLEVKGSEKNLLLNGGFELMAGPWIDLGHSDDLLSHKELGVGGFYTPSGGGAYLRQGGSELIYLENSDPLDLGYIEWKRYRLSFSQTLEPRSLPSEDIVLPVAGYYENGNFYPAITVIKHRCPKFRGAIDVWLGQVFQFHTEGQGLLDQRQVYLHSVLYILTAKGLISKKKAQEIKELAIREYLKKSRRKINGKLVMFPSVFPSSPPPAKKLFVCDVRNLPDDEKLLLVSLQGIVNRLSPSIYLIFNPVDERWLAWLKERGDIEEVEIIRNPHTLLSRFREKFKGIIITDPALPASIDGATMLAGIENALISSPRIAKYLSKPVLYDLRNKFKNNADVYDWANKKLWDKLNHQFIVSLPSNWVVMRDYAIAFRAFTFWITGELDGQHPRANPLEGQLVVENVLAQIPPNTGVLGIPYAGKGVGIQEEGGVALWSRYAKFLAWSHIPNLTVHSGTKRVTFQQTYAEPLQLENKIYITLLVSDGDAPVNWYDFFLWRYWDDPQKGRFPITWTVGPTVYDVIPDMMDYYFSHATHNDYFVCAFGAGYAFMDLYAEMYENREEIWQKFLNLTKLYMAKMGLDCLWTHHEGEDYFKIYGVNLNLKCILADYSRPYYVDSYNKSIILLNSGVPVFRSVTSFDPELGEQRNFSLLLEDTKRFTPKERPAFMHLFIQCYPMSPTLLKELLTKLGDEYVPVRPDQLTALYKDFLSIQNKR